MIAMAMEVAETIDMRETWLRVRGRETITRNMIRPEPLSEKALLTTDYRGDGLEHYGADGTVAESVENYTNISMQAVMAWDVQVPTLGPSEDMKSNCGESAINPGTRRTIMPLTEEDIVEKEHDAGELKGDSGDSRLKMSKKPEASDQCTHEENSSDVTNITSFRVEHAELPKNVTGVCVKISDSQGSYLFPTYTK